VLRVAEAFGYVQTMPAELDARMKRVVGTLVRVRRERIARPRSALTPRRGGRRGRRAEDRGFVAL